MDHLTPLVAGWSWTQFPGVVPGLELLGRIEGCNLVDIGCGYGRTAAALATAGAVVTAIDTDEARITQARETYQDSGVDFVAGNAATYLRERAGTVDLVVSKFGAADFTTSTDMLDTLLDAASEALGPGGRLAISSRHRQWDDECRKLGLDHQPGSRLLFDRAGWEWQLRHAGYHPALLTECHIPRPVLAGYLRSVDHPDIPAALGLLQSTPACVVAAASPMP